MILMKLSAKFVLKVYYILWYLSQRWIFSNNLFQQTFLNLKKVLSISDVINMSKNMSDFKKNLSVFSKENIETIEKLAMGQSENEYWFEYRKCLITASKGHEVVTKIIKVQKDGGGTVNMWSLIHKI